jgi:RNA polymerase II subunit A small phosphatase-like protein
MGGPDKSGQAGLDATTLYRNHIMEEKLLILDLDETLIFSSEKKLPFKEDFVVANYFVYKRPGLTKFINFAIDNFQLGVWSSSTSDYTEIIVNNIFDSPNILRFIWSRERCTAKVDLETREQYWIKDLKKVKKIGFDLEKVLVLDDSPEKLQRNYGNHIPILSYTGDLKDNELLKLITYLDKIKDKNSFRNIEKRDWRFSCSS